MAEHAHGMAQLEVDKVLGELGDARLESVTVQSVNGGPARQLLAAARDADMIVVGSRGAGGFARLLMGSVSTQVSHHARCPVVIVPAEDRR
jgi:nucleotide-binding universal stress UspA family protein